MALTLPFLAVLLATAAAAPPESTDDLEIARAIRRYIEGRSERLLLQVDSVKLTKLRGEIREGTYVSTWEVTLRFRAAYNRPDEDPYLSGMLRCLEELRLSAGGSWVEWAENEIERRRSEVRDLIMYIQEKNETVTAHAGLDASGRVMTSAVKLEVQGIAGAHGIEELLRAVPLPERFEEAGYRYLLSGKDPQGRPSQENEQGLTPGMSGATPGTSKETPGTGGESSPSSGTPADPVEPVGPVEPIQPVQPIEPVQPIQPLEPVTPHGTTPVRRPSVGGARSASDRTDLLYWALGLIAALLAILVWGEVYNQRKKASRRK